jgi:hypothetical protein
MIPPIFITQACEILGDTNSGLSGSKIATLCSAYALEFGIDIPYPAYPFPSDSSIPNKRAALRKNLEAFSVEQQFRIVKEMCELEQFAGQTKIRELKVMLVSRYGKLAKEPEQLNMSLIEETQHWLSDFDPALRLYNQGLEKYRNSIFERNALDDFRLSLEKLLGMMFNNSKSLENQLGEVGTFLKSKGGSPEICNMFQKLVEYFAKYQNTYIKHDDNVVEEEMEFIIELVSAIMKHFVRIMKK